MCNQEMDLNRDVWEKILNNLSLPDVLAARRSCQRIKTICDRFLTQDNRPERPGTLIVMPITRAEDINPICNNNMILFNELILPSLNFEVDLYYGKINHNQVLAVVQSLSHRPVKLSTSERHWRALTEPRNLSVFSLIHELMLHSCVITDEVLPILNQIPRVELCGCELDATDMRPLAGNRLEYVCMDGDCFTRQSIIPIFPVFPEMIVNLCEVQMDPDITETNGDWCFWVQEDIRDDNVRFLQRATGKIHLMGSDPYWMENNYDIFSMQCSSLTLDWQEEYHYLLHSHRNLQILICYLCLIDNRFGVYEALREINLLDGTVFDCNLTFRFPNLEVFNLTQTDAFHDEEDETVNFIMHDMPRLHTVSMRVPTCMVVDLCNNPNLNKLTIGPTTRVRLQNNRQLTRIEVEGSDPHEQEQELAATLEVIHVDDFNPSEFMETYVYRSGPNCHYMPLA